MMQILFHISVPKSLEKEVMVCVVRNAGARRVFHKAIMPYHCIYSQLIKTFFSISPGTWGSHFLVIQFEKLSDLSN